MSREQAYHLCNRAGAALTSMLALGLLQAMPSRPCKKRQELIHRVGDCSTIQKTLTQQSRVLHHETQKCNSSAGKARDGTAESPTLLNVTSVTETACGADSKARCGKRQRSFLAAESSTVCFHHAACSCCCCHIRRQWAMPRSLTCTGPVLPGMPGLFSHFRINLRNDKPL